MSNAVFLVCLTCLTFCATADQTASSSTRTPTTTSTTTTTTPSTIHNDPTQIAIPLTATKLDDASGAAAGATNKTAADKKRSVLIGDISYSYAATDIGTPHGTHIKTLTVIKSVAIPKHQHHGKPSEAGGKTGHTDADWEKHVKNHFNMVVRVPEFPETPSIHIGSRPASTDRNTKTPVKVELAPAAAAAPAKEGPAKATPAVVAEAKQPAAAAPAAVAAAAAVTPVAGSKCNKDVDVVDGGGGVGEAAAAAMEREIQQSMDHMHRMAHSYNKQRQHQSRFGAAAAAEPLPEAMSLIHANNRHQPFNQPAVSRPAPSEENDDGDEADAAAADHRDEASDTAALADDNADLPALHNPPTIVRSSFDNIPDDVEFVRLHAEPIASRLPFGGQHNYRQQQHHQPQQPYQPHHRQSFVEDFTDYAMHNVQHLADRPAPSASPTSADTALSTPQFHQTQQTAEQSRANQAAADVSSDDDNDYTSSYRTINARDEAELNAADDHRQLPSSPDSTSYAAETAPMGHIHQPSAESAAADGQPEHTASSSAAYKINGNRKKVRPYTAPALYKPYRTTSTTTQRVPYQAPIKSQKPAQFYIIHETPTTTQRPYLSPNIYTGYSLDDEQRQRDEQRLGAERDREERQQLELERQQLEQQQRDQLELQQRRRDQQEQQQLRDQQNRVRFMHQQPQQSQPHAEYLQATTTPASVAASTSLSPLSLFVEDEADFGGDLHNVIQQPLPPTSSSSSSAAQFSSDTVEVFAQSLDTSAASVSQSQSYRYEKPAGHRRPLNGGQAPGRKVTRKPLSSPKVRTRPVQSSSSSSSSPPPPPLLPTPAGDFVAVPLDVSTAPPFQRDHAISVHRKIPAHLVRHQFVFDSKPPHAFLESPFRPQRKPTSDGGTVESSFAFRR